MRSLVANLPQDPHKRPRFSLGDTTTGHDLDNVAGRRFILLVVRMQRRRPFVELPVLGVLDREVETHTDGLVTLVGYHHTGATLAVVAGGLLICHRCGRHSLPIPSTLPGKSPGLSHLSVRRHRLEVILLFLDTRFAAFIEHGQDPRDIPSHSL